MDVFKIYSDLGYTGANLKRPALNEMLNDIRENKINLVISYKIDRLTRSPKDFYQLIELFDKYGVDFISVTERFDTSTPSGRLLRNIMLTFAQFERELASERTKDKMLQRAGKGMWNGGFVPFGYKVEDKKLVIRRKDAKIVRQMFDLYIASGSVFDVYDELKGERVDFTKTRISYMLRNIIYTGKIQYAGKVYEGNHKAVISEEVFNLAQKIHQNRKRIMKVYKNYPLAGLLKCRECDSFMTPCHTNKRRQGRIKRYYYYRCTKTFKRDWDSCGIRQVSASRLEDYVFNNLERISLDRHYVDSLIFKLNSEDLRGRAGLELTSEPSKISPEIFGQTLKVFVKGMFERKGTDLNLWVKKFIKKIDYSKSEIALSLYYKRSFEELNSTLLDIGCPHPADGQIFLEKSPKKVYLTPRGKTHQKVWLPGLDSNQQPSGYGFSNISTGPGLSHHPGLGCRALSGLIG